MATSDNCFAGSCKSRCSPSPILTESPCPKWTTPPEEDSSAYRGGRQIGSESHMATGVDHLSKQQQSTFRLGTNSRLELSHNA